MKLTIATIKGHTCWAANPTAFFRKLSIPKMIDPIIPGKADAAFDASLPNNLASALSWSWSHFITPFSSFGGPPEEEPPPVNACTIVSISRPRAVKLKNPMIPCSRIKMFSFSLAVISGSRSLSRVCRIRANWLDSCFLFWETSSSRESLSSFSFVILSRIR